MYLTLVKIEPDSGPHVSLVVSPLRSLMSDQVTKLTEYGIKAATVLPSSEMGDGVREGY